MPRRLREDTRNFDRVTGSFKSSRSIPQFSRSSPVKEGDQIDVLIDDIGSRGDGVARIGGFLIFVPRSRTGERLRVRISKVSKNFAVAERIE